MVERPGTRLGEGGGGGGRESPAALADATLSRGGGGLGLWLVDALRDEEINEELRWSHTDGASAGVTWVPRPPRRLLNRVLHRHKVGRKPKKEAKFFDRPRVLQNYFCHRLGTSDEGTSR